MSKIIHDDVTVPQVLDEVELLLSQTSYQLQMAIAALKELSEREKKKESPLIKPNLTLV